MLFETEKFGEIGSVIKKSKYLRDYCCSCGEAIRVNRWRCGRKNECSWCNPSFAGVPGEPKNAKIA